MLHFRLRARTRATMSAAALTALLAPAAHALDLTTVWRDVVRDNPDLAAAAEMRTAARERIAPAGAWSAPMLEAGVQNLPTSGRFDADMMTMKMVMLEQRVPVTGAKGAARAAARHDYAAANADADRMRLEMLADAWTAYADAYFAGVIADAADGHDAVMARMEDAARARVTSGRGRIDEVLRAQAERARLAADGERARSEQAAALARLDALRGREPGAAREALAPPPESLAPDSSAAWTRASAAAHPRARVLDAQAARDRASADAMRRMRWPDLDLRASYGKRETLADGMKQDDMVSASVGIMLPIFSGGRELAQARAMDAMARGAEQRARAVRLDLAQSLQGARAEAHTAQRLVRVLGDTVLVLQQKTLEADWAAYAAGTADLARVLDSAHAVYALQIEIARAHQDLARACARVLTLTADGSLVGVTLPSAAEVSR